MHKYSNFFYVNNKIYFIFHNTIYTTFITENLSYKNKFSSFAKNVPQMSYVSLWSNPHMVLKLLHLQETLQLAVLEKLSGAR